MAKEWRRRNRRLLSLDCNAPRQYRAAQEKTWRREGLLVVGILCLAVLSATYSFARSMRPFTGAVTRLPGKVHYSTIRSQLPENAYQTDIDRLIELRSHSLDELIALASQLDAKWRLTDWNQYARIMAHVCSEISSRGLNDEQVREQSDHFAKTALAHSNMYSWQSESGLVGCLQYKRSRPDMNAWLRYRRQNTELWLHAWRRLEKEIDPGFDINDLKNRPSMQVFPPRETNLPPGSPPSAIKDPRLRAKYEAAIADNERKSQRAIQQVPLLLHGPSFRTRAESWLVQAYSQAPARNAELRRYLEVYVRDYKTRQRILSEVEKNSN